MALTGVQELSDHEVHFFRRAARGLPMCIFFLAAALFSHISMYHIIVLSESYN